MNEISTIILAIIAIIKILQADKLKKENRYLRFRYETQHGIITKISRKDFYEADR